MGHVTLTLEEYEALRRLITSERESEGAELAAADSPKKKRRVSKYQREFGRQMKKLKAKHPRTKVTALMSKGHAAARKALGMKQKRRSR